MQKSQGSYLVVPYSAMCTLLNIKQLIYVFKVFTQPNLRGIKFAVNKNCHSSSN